MVSTVLDRFVTDLGRTGRRHGAGFYDYPEGQRRPWAGLGEIYAPASTRHDVPTLKQRMLFIQSLEAARAFEEGVIGDPGEGDVGAVLGIGFPAYTGGVFSLIDTLGIAQFVRGSRPVGRPIRRALSANPLAETPRRPGRSVLRCRCRVNFDFSDEQQALRDQARKLFADGRLRARRMVETEQPFDRDLWRDAIGLGCARGPLSPKILVVLGWGRWNSA